MVSISAPTADGFASLAAELTLPGVAAIEANISCPNIEEDGKAFAMRAGVDRKGHAGAARRHQAAALGQAHAQYRRHAEVARAAEAAGADAVVVANTILSMAIDLKTFKPCLGNIMGGLSGPAIKPIMLRQVFQCAKAIRIPVIGCGGISQRGRCRRIHAGRSERRAGRHRDIRAARGDDRRSSTASRRSACIARSPA